MGETKNQTNIKKVHIGNAIKSEMVAQRRSAIWLAEQVGLTRRAIYDIFEKESLNSELIRLISNALNKNFFGLYDEQ